MLRLNSTVPEALGNGTRVLDDALECGINAWMRRDRLGTRRDEEPKVLAHRPEWETGRERHNPNGEILGHQHAEQQVGRADGSVLERAGLTLG